MKLQRFYSWDKRESSGFGSFGTTAHPAWWDEIRDRDPPQNETQFLAEWSNSAPPTAHSITPFCVRIFLGWQQRKIPAELGGNPPVVKRQ